MLSPGIYYADLQANVGDNYIDTYQYRFFFNGQTTATEKPIEKIEISVFPNPASDKIYLSNTDQVNEYIISDLSGKQLMQGAIDTNGIDIYTLSAGLYFIQVRLKNGEIITQRFSKI